MKKLLIIGGGVMGGILALNINSQSLGFDLAVVDKDENKLLKIKNQKPKIKIFTDNIEAIKDVDIIILAVKPQSFPDLAKEIGGQIKKNVLVISIMAGVKVEKIKSVLSVDKIIRAMPNLGARVNKSMTVWTSIGLEDKKEIENLFKSIGESLYVESEEMIDKATAVSGSGPGFFYCLVNEWKKAIIELGFGTDEAKKLLFATIDGANSVLQNEKNLEDLINQVASKGGTTEVGLQILQEKNVKEIFLQVMQTAEKRAKELSN